MDENKLIELRNIMYKVLAVCGLCKHGNFQSTDGFGTCNIHFYIHKKHGDKRNLSIHKFGRCENGYESNDNPGIKKFTSYIYMNQKKE